MDNPPVPSAAAQLFRLMARLRRQIAQLAGDRGPGAGLPRAVRALAVRAERRTAAELREAQLVAWLQPVRQLARLAGLPPTDPPDGGPQFFRDGPEDQPGTVFPQVVKAVEWVRNRVPFTPAEFDQLDADARRVAFTVARAQSLDAVETVQGAIADSIEQGGSLGAFREAVAEALEGSAIGEAGTETLYRTHVGRAYSAGQIAVLDSPAVRSAFPYLRYSATHDSRVRPDHLAMEERGLNKTAIYRADDPVWNVYYPPWAWNCRCVVIPYSIADAAAAGVREAREWLRTGRPPARPEYVEPPGFPLPKGWVVTGRRLSPLG